MAPLRPLGKSNALARLNSGKLPFAFGSPHPTVAIVEQDGVVRLRALVIDPVEAEAAMKAALAERGLWTPEQHSALGRPTGRIFLEAPTRESMAEAIEAYPWPKEW